MRTVYLWRRGAGQWREVDCDAWRNDEPGEMREFEEYSVIPPTEDELSKALEVIVTAAPWLDFVAIGPVISGKPGTAGEYLNQSRGVLVSCAENIINTLWHEIYHAADVTRFAPDDQSHIAAWLGHPWPSPAAEAARQLREDAAEAFTAWIVGALDERPPAELERVWERLRSGGYRAWF